MCDVSFILSILLPTYQAKVIINLCTIDIIKKAIIGEKSIGIRHLGLYNIKEIPSIKKRVFMDSDYSILLNLKDGE